MRREKRRLEWSQRLQKLSKFAILLILFVGIIDRFFFSVIQVEGRSMEPTFKHGDMVVLSKIGIREGNLSRGEIILFNHGSRLYVKRILGLPGERVEISDGDIYIDSKMVKNAFTKEYTYAYNIDKWDLDVGEYFVVGDNRNKDFSKDSRIFGPIKIDEIEGKYIFKLKIGG